MYTADNALVSIARRFHIKYILAKDLEESESNSVEEVSHEGLTDNTVNEICSNVVEISVKETEGVWIDLEELKRQMQLNSMSEKQIYEAKRELKVIFR